MIGGRPGDDFLDALDAVIKSVVRFYHWSPNEIENLYLDDTDFFGLIYWYDDLHEMKKQNTPNK